MQLALKTIAALALGGLISTAGAQDATFEPRIRVAASTRLDWAYPLAGASSAAPPAHLLKDYESTAQSYEFYGPATAPRGELPLVIFISHSDRPVGWMCWESTCRTHGVLYAGLQDMGNGRPTAHRVRAVLDVLDDVRERYAVDADRTYVAGYSGGAYIAALTALALPEYFGGVACMGHAPQPPRSAWDIDRVCQRLSLSIACG